MMYSAKSKSAAFETSLHSNLRQMKSAQLLALYTPSISSRVHPHVQIPYFPALLTRRGTH